MVGIMAAAVICSALMGELRDPQGEQEGRDCGHLRQDDGVLAVTDHAQQQHRHLQDGGTGAVAAKDS